MSLVRALPPTPLSAADAARIRAREGVEVFTTVGTASVRGFRRRGREPATRAVALVDGTVRAFEFGDAGWSEEVLRREADHRDHLDAALDWMHAD